MHFFTSIFSKLVVVYCFASCCNVSSAIDVNPEEGYYFEGDILEPLSTINPNTGYIDDQFQWPNKEVVYELDEDFPEEFRTTFMSSLNHIVGRTCIRFRKRTIEEDYVHVFHGDGCYSNIGKVGGKQNISLGSGCTSFGTNVHELLHTIGLYHEHSRSDRDDYITINWKNIAEEKQQNFKKMEYVNASTVTLPPYDYDSIMHLGRLAFSMNGHETITAKSGAAIGQREAMSDLDRAKVNEIYCPMTVGILIVSVEDQQVNGSSREGRSIIASEYFEEDNQIWTVHWGDLMQN